MFSILGTRIDPTNYEAVVDTVIQWAAEGKSKYVCVATVNQVMEAYDSDEFLRVMNGAALVTPDGMPLVWGLKLLGYKEATRVYGPDLTPLLLERAAAENIPVGFYGGAPHVLEKLVQTVQQSFPALRVAYQCSPPFQPLTPEEDAAVMRDINDSGARLLFIGLSSPKQDQWMAAHKDRVRAVMIGVGAAFDFLAGEKPQAPRWMMNIGMEWFFRLLTEPRRLWKRYLKHNPRFVVLFGVQLLKQALKRPEATRAS